MKELEYLLQIIKLLRHPKNQYHWIKEQIIDSITSDTITEVYELVNLMECNDMDSLRDKLGDLLFHIIFYSEMTNEKIDFHFIDVVKSLNERLKRHHPSIFPDSEVNRIEQIKQQECHKNKTEHKNLLDDIRLSIPAIMCAKKLQERTASVGFDWKDQSQILKKLEEELQELKEAIRKGTDKNMIEEELGDLMFCCINLARHVHVDSESALRKTNKKFVKRFNYIENTLKSKDKALANVTLAEMDSLWNQAKTQLT